MTNTYMDAKSSSFEKRARIDLLDLKEQGMGEMHIFFKSTIVRAKAFFANPKPVKRLKLNQFLKVDGPPDDVLHSMQERMQRFQQVLASGDITIDKAIDSEDIELVSKSLAANEFLDPIERAVSALLAYHNRQEPEEMEDFLEEETADELNLFTPLRTALETRPPITEDYDRFSEPLLVLQETRANSTVLERLSGKIDKHANNIAAEIIKDMQLATRYPPEERDSVSANELAGMVGELSRVIRVERESAGDDDDIFGDL